MKLKKRSCPLCKPHKMGWDTRFKAKALDNQERSEKEREEWLKVPGVDAEIRCDEFYDIYDTEDDC